MTVVVSRRGTVVAAGCVVWRTRKGRIEVLLVHRPRYNDWSWPKGKIDEDEPLAVCAAREVREETGLAVNLSQPLPGAVYALPDGRRKVVHYWAAHVRAKVSGQPMNAREIDETKWVAIDDAEQWLTRKSDLTQLDAITRMHQFGVLETQPFIIQRHSQARPRKSWTRGETTRPLTTKGREQSKRLVKMLAVYGVLDVLSSPWARCLLTVEPYVTSSGAALRTQEKFTEAAHAENPGKVADAVGRLVSAAKPIILCLHRPVLPTVIKELHKYCDRSVMLDLPRRDPYLAAGEMLVVHVSRDGQIRAIERHAA